MYSTQGLHKITEFENEQYDRCLKETITATIFRLPELTPLLIGGVRVINFRFFCRVFLSLNFWFNISTNFLYKIKGHERLK